MKSKYTMAVVCLSVAMLFSACSKTPTTTLKIHLTSTPGSYEAVNVEIKAVWVKISKDNTGWFFLNTTNSQLNLNRISKGRDTIIAAGSIPQSEIKEVRLIFGPKNSLVNAGKPYTMELSSDLDGGAVTVRVQQSLNKSETNITFNFDASASVKESAGNQYTLLPVLSPKL